MLKFQKIKRAFKIICRFVYFCSAAKSSFTNTRWNLSSNVRYVCNCTLTLIWQIEEDHKFYMAWFLANFFECTGLITGFDRYCQKYAFRPIYPKAFFVHHYLWLMDNLNFWESAMRNHLQKLKVTVIFHLRKTPLIMIIISYKFLQVTDLRLLAFHWCPNCFALFEYHNLPHKQLYIDCFIRKFSCILWL